MARKLKFDLTVDANALLCPNPNEFYSKESKLLANFSILKFKLENIENLDPSALFHPFLCVIKSGETTGAITQAALDSLEKFIDSYEEEKRMNVVCAWCGGSLGQRKGPFGKTSHGVCEQCHKSLAV